MEITMKDEEKIKVIQAVVVQKMSKQQAGQVLRKSVRQVNRLIRRFGDHGIRGVIHGNRGKPSPRKITPLIRKKILVLVRGTYADINDTQLSEILERDAKITIGRETLRAMLREEKMPAKLKRRGRQHRQRRERKAAFGIMLQIDGSPHDWLEGRGPWLTLIGAKDDATSFVWAQFEEAETTWGYLGSWGCKKVCVNGQRKG